MAEQGLAMVKLAKVTGTWNAMDDIENLVIPEDLKQEFDNNPQANHYYNLFPPSVKRGILEWIASAKKSETRKKRILETVKQAEKNIRANQYKR